jgi:molybdopterin-guanine dinucleotide biosynthesis protein A
MRVVMPRFLVGVLIGGQVLRMGGVPKGLLPAPDTNEPLVTRLARISGDALPTSEFVLVGDASPYAHLGFQSIPDEPPGIGPIGALIALLSRALRTNMDVIALATDLPFVTSSLIERLALHAPTAVAIAPRVDGLWQPLFARYRSEPSLVAAKRVVATRRYALHRVLAELGADASELPLTVDEQLLLRDWDTPTDVGAR